jgi:hypothetical protein
MTTHEKTKKHASNLAKNQVQTGDAKEQHERDLMGLEDVNVIIPEPKVKKPKKYTIRQNRRIIENWVKMTTGRNHYTVTHLKKAGYYVKYIEEHKINIQEVEQWIKEQDEIKKARDAVWSEAHNIVQRYNKLVNKFIEFSEDGVSHYPFGSIKGGLSPMEVIEKYEITTEKFDIMDKEYAIENEKFLERQRKIQEHKDKHKMEIERLKGLIEECDEDTQIEIAKEVMEMKSVPLREYIIKNHQGNLLYHPIPDPTQALRYLNERGGSCNGASQFRYKITWDNEKNWWDEDANVTLEVDLNWYMIEGKKIDIYTEIIERHYDNYTRGFVMK